MVVIALLGSRYVANDELISLSLPSSRGGATRWHDRRRSPREPPVARLDLDHPTSPDGRCPRYGPAEVNSSACRGVDVLRGLDPWTEGTGPNVARCAPGASAALRHV